MTLRALLALLLLASTQAQAQSSDPRVRRSFLMEVYMRAFLVFLTALGLSPSAPACAVSLFGDDSQALSIGLGDTFDQAILTDASTLVMSGGEVTGDLSVLDAATATVSGGTLGGPVEVYDGGSVTLEGDGSDFAVDGTIQPYGTVLDALSCPSCLLTGALADGSLLAVPVQIAFGGQLTWVGNPIPEPSTVLLMGLGLLGLAIGGRRHRPRESP